MEKYTYSIPENPLTGEPSTTIIIRSDGLNIPVNEDNADYQEYLNPKQEASAKK